MDVPEPLQQALGDSIASGKFIDTKLWAFTSRNKTTGRVGRPQPLFVNSRVLRSLPYFQHVLSGDDDVEDVREGFPDLLESFSDDYDYSSDSDLEVDDEDVEPRKVGKPQAVAEATHLDGDTSTAPDNEKCGDILHIEREDAQSETSGVMSVSDVESSFGELDDVKCVHVPENPSLLTSANLACIHGTADLRHLAKTVVIADVAFVTVRAALRYLYTNDIEFAPLGDTKSRENAEVGREPHQVPQPSPKSVYRLATKYNIPGLKILALEEIKRTLDNRDVVEEVFSKYTSRFPEIREVQVEHLARGLLSSGEPWKTAALKRKIECYISGALPHAQDVLPALYHRLANPLTLRQSTPSVRTPRKVQTPLRDVFDWQVLKTELTKSLSGGVFLNMELYAPASRLSGGRPKLRPLYFCSAVGGEHTIKMLSFMKEISSGSNETLDNAYRYDSDVEDDEVSECMNESKPVQARSLRESSTASFGVLNASAWKTWRAILYYLYTNKITFGRLSSQPPVSVEDGAPGKVGRRRAESFQMSPPSPKSVYTLACMIGLLPLRGLAFEDFKSRIDSTNITQELLSPFSARHATIRTLLLRLFETGLKSPGNEELFITSLRTSAGGQTPHRSAVIGMVFERLIEEGRKALSPPTKPKPPSTFEYVTITATTTTTTTTTTKSPPNTASSNGGGSETTKLTSDKESDKPKKTNGKKTKRSERAHSPPCSCGICKRLAKASKKT